ncbi:MAG: hypothetical protein ACI4D6_12070, partial [Chordicoccus sp.]
EEEKYLNTKKELEARLVVALGGRAAEEIVFDTVTTGAANDIEQATGIARAMITQYGMSEKFGLMGLATTENQYLDGRPVMNCGDETATEVDHEVMLMLKNAYEEAKSLLRAHRATLDRIAEYLITRETITGKEFMKIFRECENIPDNADSSDASAAGSAQAGAAGPFAGQKGSTAADGAQRPQTGASSAESSAQQPQTGADDASAKMKNADGVSAGDGSAADENAQKSSDDKDEMSFDDAFRTYIRNDQENDAKSSD